MNFADNTLKEFNEVLASDAPTPGGGSVAGLSTALSASLIKMVVNLTDNAELDKYGDELEKLQKEGLELIDRDAESFNTVMDAYRLPKESDAEEDLRNAKIQSALREASLIPIDTMRLGVKLLNIVRDVAEKGNPNAASDAGVAALMGLAAIKGGNYNVKINVSSLKDETTAQLLLDASRGLLREGESLAKEVEELTEDRIF